MPGFLADEFGWFTPVDVEQLFRALARIPNPENIVLVGGQSLAFWVDYFEIPYPEFDTPALTQDADFFGLAVDAEYLAKALGARVFLATMDHITPNTATLEFVGQSGQRLLIDFLSMLIGLKDEEIKRLAVEFTRDDQRLRVLHPLLCLESRFHNLHRLSAKRNTNGVIQARLAVEVARAYIESVQDDRLLPRKAARRVVAPAGSQAGIFVNSQYGIDPLDAVVPSSFSTDRDFRDTWWPLQTQKIDRKRRLAERGHTRLMPS